jgi:serine-type D-Ala-D-Ala carboxypeptidase (penicillin-binding protein 5/6)
VKSRRLRRWLIVTGGVAFCLLSGLRGESVARPRRHHHHQAVSQGVSRPRRAPSAVSFTHPARLSAAEYPPLPSAQTFAEVLLQDADTGQILFSQNSSKPWPAASLTKMMVALLTLEEIEGGRLSLQTPVPISRRASRAGGRMINLRPGEVFPLADLLRAMIVTSANDAAVAIAERLKGSVEDCVKAMNRRARELGMSQTLYQTPNGLPLTDGTPPDVSTAEDMATLARALVKHGQILQWTSLHSVPFRDGRIMLPNTNHLVGKVAGVDGLKTGFTYKARFNLVTTAQRDQLRLIAVVMGGQSSGLRFRVAADLLEWGFAHFTRLRLIKGGEPVGAEVRVEQGSVSLLQPVAATDAAFLLRKGEAEDFHISLQLPPVVAAPIARHQVLGEVVIRNSTRVLAIIPALSPWDVPKARWFPAQR